MEREHIASIRYRSEYFAQSSRMHETIANACHRKQIVVSNNANKRINS